MSIASTTAEAPTTDPERTTATLTAAMNRIAEAAAELGMTPSIWHILWLEDASVILHPLPNLDAAMSLFRTLGITKPMILQPGAPGVNVRLYGAASSLGLKKLATVLAD